MMAFSGSVEGRSGSVIRPAPSCLRLVRDEEWLVRREPFPARLIGDEPVPVVTWLGLPVDARADGVLLLDTFGDLLPPQRIWISDRRGRRCRNIRPGWRPRNQSADSDLRSSGSFTPWLASRRFFCSLCPGYCVTAAQARSHRRCGRVYSNSCSRLARQCPQIGIFHYSIGLRLGLQLAFGIRLPQFLAQLELAREFASCKRLLYIAYASARAAEFQFCKPTETGRTMPSSYFSCKRASHSPSELICVSGGGAGSSPEPLIFYRTPRPMRLKHR